MVIVAVQILDEADCISRSTNTLGKGTNTLGKGTNTLGKGMNPIILPPAMGK